MNALEETKYLIKKYNVRANKNLGQNFLIDDQVLNDIVEGAKIEKDDLVIEIGPGLGTLTALLLEKANKVICVELDKKMIEILQDRFIAYNNIEIINNDIMKLDLNNIIKEEKNKNKIKAVKVVANLPYYITTPIIMKLIENDLDIFSITVMIQKEVADRLIEIPGGKSRSRSFGSRISQNLRSSRFHQPLLKQLRTLSLPGETHTSHDSQCT